MSRRRGRQQQTTLFGTQAKRRVALYARVSTEDQKDAGTVQTQLLKLRQMAEVKSDEWEVVGEYVDEGISGAIPLDERPFGAQLVEDAGQFDLVAVYKLDRMARTLANLIEAHDTLLDAGVAIFSIQETFDTSTAAGKLVFQILGSIAEFERSTIMQRTFDGRDRVASTGRWVTGPIPRGYDLDEAGFLVPGDEAPLWTEVFQRVAWEGSSAVAEAQRLTAIRVSTARRYPGGKVVEGAAAWQPSTLQDILHNTVYKGVREFTLSDGAVSRSDCPALVDEQTWNRAQERLTANKRRSHNGTGRDYLLRGLIVCGNCEHAYVGWPHSSGTVYYNCTSFSRHYMKLGIPKCGGKLVPADEIEQAVWERCKQIILHPDEALADAQKIVRERIAGTPDTSAQQADLRRQISEWQAQIDQQKALFRARLSTLDETEQVVRSAERHIATLDAELQSLCERAGAAQSVEDQFVQFAADVHNLSSKLEEVERVGDAEAKRLIIERLIAEVRVTTYGEGKAK